MGLFDGLPIPSDKAHFREDLGRIDKTWAAVRFDALPYVVRLLTSTDELQFLKEQSEVIEDVVNEVVHAYHSGFNRAIQNYSQEMTKREYPDDLDAEEPDDYIISLTAQITGDEAIAPFVPGIKQNYIFGGICGVAGIAANSSIKALVDMKSIDLFGVRELVGPTEVNVHEQCVIILLDVLTFLDFMIILLDVMTFLDFIFQFKKGSHFTPKFLVLALVAVPSIDCEAVQLRLDRVRIYFELLNMPLPWIIAYFAGIYQSMRASLLQRSTLNFLRSKSQGEIPADAQDKVSEILC